MSFLLRWFTQIIQRTGDICRDVFAYFMSTRSHFDHEAHAELLQTVRNEINGTDMRNTFETHEQNVNGVKSEAHIKMDTAMLLALAYAAIDAANKLEKEKNDLSESMTDDSTNSIDASCKGEKPTTLITSVDETSDADELFSCEQTLDESYMVEMDSDEEINSLSECYEYEEDEITKILASKLDGYLDEYPKLEENKFFPFGETNFNGESGSMLTGSAIDPAETSNDFQFRHPVAETKFYDLLGVSPYATDNELKKAYQKVALRVHPDKQAQLSLATVDVNDRKSCEKMQLLGDIYNVLRNPQLRSLYDSYGEEFVNKFKQHFV